MILASMVTLIGALVVRVGTDIASNIENRIIDAAIDVVNQKQQPLLSELNLATRTLQKNQDEIKENQIREIKVHYKNGIDFIRYANTATDSKQKIHFINNAIESFTYASNIEVGEAAVNARVLVGACFFALRRIDSTTPIDLENGEYDKAFQLAERTPGPAPQTPYIRSIGQPLSRLYRQPPSRELIEQLLRIPYLQQKYGPIEIYWKKWEPPKIEWKWAQPKQVESPSVSKPLGNNQRFLPRAKQFTIRKTCQKCYKQFDEPFGSFNPKNYCPECRSKYP